MDFRFTPEQEQFRDSVRRFAEKHLAKGARERAHSPEYPWTSRSSGRPGASRDHHRRSRRRPGRRADRRGDRDRDRRLGVPQKRRRRAGGQLRADPRFSPSTARRGRRRSI